MKARAPHYSLVERCSKCGSLIHIVRLRYCCGIDHLNEALNQEHEESPEWDSFLLLVQEETIEHDLIVTRAIMDNEQIRLKRLEKEKKQMKSVRKKHERAKKSRSYNMSKELKASILLRDNHKCVECGSKEGLHVHHKIHKSKGGTNETDNLVTLCELCHAEKHRGEQVYNLMIKRIWKQISI